MSRRVSWLMCFNSSLNDIKNNEWELIGKANKGETKELDISQYRILHLFANASTTNLFPANIVSVPKSFAVQCNTIYSIYYDGNGEAQLREITNSTAKLVGASSQGYLYGTK